MSAETSQDHYLDKLFTIVNDITPIDDVYITSSGTYAVAYENGVNPPSGTLSDVNNVLDNWSTNKQRFVLIDNENDYYDNLIGSGYIVASGDLSVNTANGKSFLLDTESITYLNMQLLAAETNSDTTISVDASDGSRYDLSISDMRSLLVKYAAAAVTIRQNRFTAIKNINTTFNGYTGGGSYTNIIP